MAIGEIALNVSAVFAALAAAASIHRLLGRDLTPRAPRLLALFAGVFAAIALASLLQIFLATDLDYLIVYQDSARDLPTLYKLSGAWAGEAGSMVLWSCLIAVAWGIEELRWWVRARRGAEPREEPLEPRKRRDEGTRRRKRKDRAKGRRSLAERQAERTDEGPRGWLTLDLVRTVVMLVLVLMLTATMVMDPFQHREGPPVEDGRGLNRVLQTPLMVVHPPIVFLAYALVTITFGAGLAFAIRGDRNWVLVSRPWTRGAWLMLTLGIGIGGMWAYETLGWGGYWAWDPVETSSLIPWIALTALVHAQVRFERRGEYRYMAPFLAGTAMFLVLFATFVTRSGVWTSVHAYAGASASTALERVSEAISGSSSLFWIYLTMWIVGLATVIPPVFRLLRSKEEAPLLQRRGEGESRLEWFSRRSTTMFATVFLLSVSTLLVLLILTTAADGTVGPGEYHGRLGFFVVPLMAVLVTCMATRVLDRRRGAVAAALALLAGLAGWAINPGGLDPPVVWVGVVMGIFGLLVVLGDAARHVWRHRRSPRRLLSRSGSILVHLGLVMVFTAYCLSNVAVPREVEELSAAEGDAVELEDHSVALRDRGWAFDGGNRDRDEFWDVFGASIVLSTDGEVTESRDVQVIAEYQWHPVGTLTYETPDGPRAIDCEVLRYEPIDSVVWVTVRSLADSEVVLRVPMVNITVWPALETHAARLMGHYVRINSVSDRIDGFLEEVGPPGGDVVVRTFSGRVSIHRAEVDSLSRRAEVRIVESEVVVHRTALRDVYLTVTSVSPHADGSFSARVLVKEVPAMSMLWWGMYIMAAGVVLRPLEALARSSPSTDAEEGREGASGEDGSDGGQGPEDEEGSDPEDEG